MNFILLFSLLLIVIALAVYCWWLIVWVIGGISILPTSHQTAKAVAGIIKKHKPDAGVFYDLGCGQGTAARRIKKTLPAMKVFGIDNSLNQYLFGIIKNTLSFKKIHLLRQDLFGADISQADIIYLYLPRPILPRLKEKIKNETKRGAIIITNTVSFAGWPPIETIVTHQKSPAFEKLFVYKVEAK